MAIGGGTVNHDGSTLSGSGLHRYLSEEQTATILAAMALQMGERPGRGRILDVLSDTANWSRPVGVRMGPAAQDGQE